MAQQSQLSQDYPWIKTPLICSAPMRLIAGPALATEVSKAGGLGFIGSGNDQSNLKSQLEEARKRLSDSQLESRASTLPVGIGFINWGADLDLSTRLIAEYRPAAIWLFAPRQTSNFVDWTASVRKATDGATKVWVQVGSVKDALEVMQQCNPDVLVLQGSDAGGHGLNKGCGIISLIPETIDALEQALSSGKIDRMPSIIGTGGIVEGRGAAAALTLGAEGVCLGTRYLVAEEADIARGYKDELIRASDGGQNTVRSSVYDTLRGTTDWPEAYGGRGVINQSYHDAMDGVSTEQNKKMYEEAMKTGDSGWGPEGRMTTYSGTGVGLIKKIQSAKEITEEIRQGTVDVLRKVGSRTS